MGTIMYKGESYGGGGGTNVVANPSGTATGTLNKLQVGSNIYSVGGGSGTSETYSTSEQVIGTWIDNKPIYQKTIYVASHNGGSQVIDNTLTMNDISYIALKEINYIVNNTYMDGTQMGIELVANANGINLDSNNSPLNSLPLTDIYITIRYTKVADIQE